jgi:aldehyde:ferredoxin oxidoreductase
MTPDEFRRARDEFYTHQGWSLDTGAPTEETLQRVGLTDLSIGREHRAAREAYFTSTRR